MQSHPSCILLDEKRQQFSLHVRRQLDREPATIARNYGFRGKPNLLTSSTEQPLLSFALCKVSSEGLWCGLKSLRLPISRYLHAAISLLLYFLMKGMGRGTNPDCPDSRPISMLHSAVTLIQTNRRITLILSVASLTQSAFRSLSMVLKATHRLR